MTRIVFWVFLSAGVAGLAQAHYLQLKAVLAQHLIAWSWDSAQDPANRAPIKPWWWADFSTVAKLRWQDHEVFVLSSVSGQALAFGPGHLPGSARPGRSGRSIVAGHNDSHFDFLETVQTGDVLHLESLRGEESAYTVTGIEVVDSRYASLLLSEKDELLLVTCYPFRSVQPDSPMRLVVSASKQRERV